MNFPNIINSPCIPTTQAPVDQNCTDPAYAALNPDTCGNTPFLRIKPGVLLTCPLGSVQFQAYSVTNGVETLLTSGVSWSVSNMSVAVIGASSGSATGLSAGEATVSATANNLSATANLTVLAGSSPGGSFGPLIPVMTSNTFPSGVASSNNTQILPGVYTQPWWAMNGGNGANNLYWGSGIWAGDVNPPYLQYQFEAPAVATQWVLYGDFEAATLAGSHDGVNFTNLSTIAAGVGSLTPVTFNNANAYLYYRVTFAQSGNQTSAVNTFQLYGIGGPSGCCGGVTTATVLVVDKSHSMSLAFGGGFSTKQAFADALALNYANQTNTNKGDTVSLIEFDSAPTTDSGLTLAASTVANQAGNIVTTANLTGIGLALQSAVNILAASSAAVKVIVLISDGEDKDTTPANAPVPIATAFHNSGGIIMCVGVRASTTTNLGFNLLSALATGGFFVNCYPSNATTTIQQVYGLKGYLCAGNCAPPGNNFVNEPSANYTTFANWNASGSFTLDGPGLIDPLPGNGLYVDIGANSTLTSKTSFNFTAGKTYEISFWLAGNQLQNTGTQNVTVTLGAFSQTVAITSFTQAFQQYSFNFTPQTSYTAPIVFTNPATSASSFGPFEACPLLDDIALTDVTDATLMFSDNFDGENLQYVPPACGAVRTGTGVVSNAIANPLAVTVNDNGFGGISNPNAPTLADAPNTTGNLIPVMTSDTTPSGVASASSYSNPPWFGFSGLGGGDFWSDSFSYHGASWLQYQFPTALVATQTIIVGDFSAWNLQGSNDGSTWTTLASGAGATSSQTTSFSNSTAYLYYRWNWLGGAQSSAIYSAQLVGTIPAGNMTPGDQNTYYVSYQVGSTTTGLSSGAAHTVGAGASAILITLPGGVPPQVTGIQIWRFLAFIPPTRFLLATLPVSATTYTDTLSNSQFSLLGSAPAPSSNNTNTSPGDMSGGDVYSYEISYLTANGHTAVSPATSHTVGANIHSVNIGFPAGQDPSVTNIQLWRQETVGAGPARYYLMATLSPSVTTYTDQQSHADFQAILSASPTPPVSNSTAAGYGYFWYYGYNCYGYGCLSTPPGPEIPDPNPLPDIESDYVPPTQYSATLSATATCPANSVQMNPTSAIPQLSADTNSAFNLTPSSELTGYEAYRAFGAGPAWRGTQSGSSYVTLTGQLAAAALFGTFAVTPDATIGGIPVDIEMLGSNDGMNFTGIGTFNAVTMQTGDPSFFPVVNPGNYLYYQLAIRPTGQSGQTVGVQLFQYFAPCPGCNGVTQSATATSLISQVDANNKATAAALSLAQQVLAQYGCIATYTSTKSFTAYCPVGRYDGNNGLGYTASATYVSYISQGDADTNALALATANANTGINCNQSNNSSLITIRNGAAATPYPSVSVYSGAITSISRIQVGLNNMLGGPASTVSLFLVSPSGLGVCLLSGVGDINHAFASANLILDSNSSTSLPFSGNVVSGTFKPTESGSVPTPLAPCPAISFPASFNGLIGTNPIGAWSLWCVQNGSPNGQPPYPMISGWTLTIS